MKKKKANTLGLYDMSGNVSEWCSDWYSDRYDAKDTNNPTGRSRGVYRVVRGGGWCDYDEECLFILVITLDPTPPLASVSV